MTSDEVLSNVQDIFRDIFDEKDLIIENGTTSNDIEGWDSLNHIGIISAAEKAISIDPDNAIPSIASIKLNTFINQTRRNKASKMNGQ